MTIEDLNKAFEGATINITKRIGIFITPQIIERIIAEEMDTNTEIIRSPRQFRISVFPRYFMMYMLKKYTKLSLNGIGAECKNLNGKKFDHATVLYGIRIANNLITTERKYRELAAKIEYRINLIGS